MAIQILKIAFLRSNQMNTIINISNIKFQKNSNQLHSKIFLSLYYYINSKENKLFSYYNNKIMIMLLEQMFSTFKNFVKLLLVHSSDRLSLDNRCWLLLQKYTTKSNCNIYLSAFRKRPSIQLSTSKIKC